MKKYILDTNLFFNMEAHLNLGEKTEDVILNLTEVIEKCKENNEAEFYMSPRIVDEFLSFFEDKNKSLLQDFLAQIIIKSPDYTQMNVSATVFYQLIEDVRGRSYRGLQVAEEEIQKVAQTFSQTSETLSKKDFQMKVGPTIKHFRERYRQATRVGFLDSLADLDLMMLAKEQDAFVVSTDEGLLKWARIFGVKEMPAVLFGKAMKS